MFYAEAQGVISTKDGKIATWKGYGIGYYHDHNRTDRASVFFKSSTNRKLSFLNNKIGVFEYKADTNGNTNGKIIFLKYVFNNNFTSRIARIIKVKVSYISEEMKSYENL
jgi:hypothetical protein